MMAYMMIISLIIVMLLIVLVIYYDRHMNSKNAIRLLGRYSQYIKSTSELNATQNLFTENKLYYVKHSEDLINSCLEIKNIDEYNSLIESIEARNCIFYCIPQRQYESKTYFTILKFLTYFDFLYLINFSLLIKIISIVYLVSLTLIYLSLENILELLGIPTPAILVNTFEFIQN
jgi:hypothetical protein